MKRSFTQNFLTKTAILMFFMFGLQTILHSFADTQPDAFIVEVQPSSFEANQAVDITIKAVTANGDIVKNYQGDVFIEIDGIGDTSEYVVPSEGLYSFMAQDQGAKLFSKGLIVKRQGTFAVRVSDIINEAIVGEKTIIVGGSYNTATTESITIMSPAAEGTEKNNNINIIASSLKLPNSPYNIFLNNSIVAQGMTDSLGDINTYISGVIAGQNLLQIKITNAQNEIIGESETMRFTYTPVKDGIFDSIQILPSSKIKQGSKTTFNLSTDDTVSSATLTISNGKRFPMDRSAPGLFTKDAVMDTEGTLEIGTELISAGQTKIYTGITRVIVEKSVTIGKIRLYSDSIDKTKLNITRETIGSAPQYKVQYGTSDLSMNQFVIVATNEIIVENLKIGTTYFFQIVPLDANQNTIGAPSEITQTVVGEATSCIVKNITIAEQKIGDKYYLVRSGVENADSYIIYRSEFETNDSSKMQKVGQTTGTMFEYPFNKTSKKEEYAYYLVEAICKDGTNIKIDNAKKIQVGPVENILLFIIITLFGYCIYRLYKHSNN